MTSSPSRTAGARGFVVVLVLALIAVLAPQQLLGASPLAVGAMVHVYDASVVVRADVQAMDAFNLPTLREATRSLEWSVSPLAPTRGMPTTPLAPGVGAETASAADQAAYDYATQANKLDHILADKHNFGPLVQQFGSREAVVQQMLNGLKGLTPASGTFEETIQIGGQQVVVRGAVVNGVVKIGTAFTP